MTLGRSLLADKKRSGLLVLTGQLHVGFETWKPGKPPSVDRLNELVQLSYMCFVCVCVWEREREGERERENTKSHAKYSPEAEINVQ
jgi:hypothetical protein